MKKVLLSLVVLMSLAYNAQVVFCPPGAEWNYIFSNGFGPSKFNEKIKYTHDSLVDGLTTKVLSHKWFFSSYAEYANPTLIRQIGDTVFMRNARTQHTWQVLYNYSALPGQSWYNSIIVGTISNSAIANYTITVDSVTQIVDNGFNLKRLYVRYFSSYGNGGSYYQGSITERYGCNNFLFNFRNRAWTDGDFVTAFLCYGDSSFVVKQFTTLDCNYSNPVGVEENELNNGLRIFPNPTDGFVRIKIDDSQNKKLLVKIIDLSGRLIEEHFFETTNNLEINTSGFKAGVYFVSVFYEGKLVETKKLLIVK